MFSKENLKYLAQIFIFEGPENSFIYLETFLNVQKMVIEMTFQRWVLGFFFLVGWVVWFDL